MTDLLGQHLVLAESLKGPVITLNALVSYQWKDNNQPPHDLQGTPSFGPQSLPFVFL